MDDRIDICMFLKNSAHKVLIRQVSLVKDSIWMHRCTVACDQAIDHDDFFLSFIDQAVHHVGTDIASSSEYEYCHLFSFRFLSSLLLYQISAASPYLKCRNKASKGSLSFCCSLVDSSIFEHARKDLAN